MKEQPNFSVRSAIKVSREIKNQSKENNTVVRGRRGKNIEQIQADVGQILGVVMSENQDWINEQKNKIQNIIPDINDEELFGTFERGLMTFFKQQYRLFTQDQQTSSTHELKIIPDILKDKEYIRQQITAYTFDFIQLLKKSIKEGMTSRQALEAASLAYRHNPNIFRELTIKYPDATEMAIDAAIIGYPSKSEKFLEGYRQRVAELSSKYPEIDKWVINFVAVAHPSHPEKTIDRFLKLIPKLKEKYPHIRLTAIKQAALEADPDNFIKNFKSWR